MSTPRDDHTHQQLSRQSIAAAAKRDRLAKVAAERMTPAEVARVFGVSPGTVTRWAQTGKLDSIRTLGGHRRFLRAEVDAFIIESSTGMSTT